MTLQAADNTEYVIDFFGQRERGTESDIEERLADEDYTIINKLRIHETITFTVNSDSNFHDEDYEDFEAHQLHKMRG